MIAYKVVEVAKCDDVVTKIKSIMNGLKNARSIE